MHQSSKFRSEQIFKLLFDIVFVNVICLDSETSLFYLYSSVYQLDMLTFSVHHETCHASLDLYWGNWTSGFLLALT